MLDEYSSLYLMDINGENVTLLKHVNEMTFMDFDWNNNGDKILIEGWSDFASFYTINDDGNNFLKITSLGVCTESPTWSLENDYIFCTGQDGLGGGTGIDHMLANGTNRINLLPDSLITELERHPSSNYLYYTAPGEYTLNIHQ